MKQFTQTNKQKKLFRTEEDIVANIQTQFGMPHTGKDLLLDAKMGPNKNQSSRLDSEPDALSDTGMSDDVGAGDTSGILHDSAGGNKKTIAGTNTPRASRASAYYDLLRSQHKNGHYKAPAYRVVDTIIISSIHHKEGMNLDNQRILYFSGGNVKELTPLQT